MIFKKTWVRYLKDGDKLLRKGGDNGRLPHIYIYKGGKIYFRESDATNPDLGYIAESCFETDSTNTEWLSEINGVPLEQWALDNVYLTTASHLNIFDKIL